MIKKEVYWLIVVKWTRNSDWGVEFGDWDSSVVRQEARDTYKGECYAYRITSSTGEQSDIDAIVNDFNERNKHADN